MPSQTPPPCLLHREPERADRLSCLSGFSELSQQLRTGSFSGQLSFIQLTPSLPPASPAHPLSRALGISGFPFLSFRKGSLLEPCCRWRSGSLPFLWGNHTHPRKPSPGRWSGQPPHCVSPVGEEPRQKQPEYGVVPRVSQTGQDARVPERPGSLESLLIEIPDSQAGSSLGDSPDYLPLP